MIFGRSEVVEGVGERIEKGCWVAGDSGVSEEVVRVREGCCREEK